MRLFILLLSVSLFFISCQSSSKDSTTQTNIEEKSQKEQIRAKKTITIYVHGYNEKGSTKNATYGALAYDANIKKVVGFTDFATLNDYDKEKDINLIAQTSYYGDTPPEYYTQKDIEDLEKITKIYGGGIPRYATIIGKFAKHVMKTNDADYVNIVSGSMGSLITRWLIEKDVENLASAKKIKKWLSINGVIRGNYAASSPNLVSILENFVKKTIDSKHMNYKWIKANLNPDNSIANSPYYKHIRVGQISSTDDETNTLGLSYYLQLNGNFIPNDGYQLLRDTYFKTITQDARFYNQPPTHTIFHKDHVGIKDYLGAWSALSTFLTSNKRVKITLTKATIDDIAETTNYFSKNAEIVFESSVYSQKVYEKWGVSDAISQRVYNSGALKVYPYKKDGQTRNLNQIIFDSFVLQDESELTVQLKGFEIDRSSKYNINEPFIGSNKKELGYAKVTLPLENALIEVISDDEWRGYLKIEVFNYPDEN